MDRDALVIMFAAAALLVRVGMALYVTGLCRAKNAAGSVVRTMCDLCVAALAFWAVGNAILQQTSNRWLGMDVHLLAGWSDVQMARSLLHLVIVLIATGVVGGVLAERTRFVAICGVSLLMSAVIVPVAGHWAWVGWLGSRGFVDVAGAAVIHLTAALCALVGAIAVGARSGKYNRDGSSNAIPGHNLPLALVGVLVMVVGWLPYVLGGTQWSMGSFSLAATGMNVLMAGAAGGLVALVYGRLRYGKPEVFLTYSGLLGGLVAISAAAGSVSSLSAVLIGAVAGLAVPVATILIDLRIKVDDPTGQIAIHGIGGLWGTLAVALFTPGGLMARVHLLGVQAVGVVAISAVTVLLSAGLFLTLKATKSLRSTEADEFDGLDLAELDINAYPDFQQTMIKSYHLREA